MAGLQVGLLLLVSWVTFLQIGGGSAYTWNAGQWMQKFGEETKCDKHTAKAVEQLTNKIHELQQNCNTGKETQITAQYEQKLKEQNEKFEQEIWKLRLQTAEYRIKDEIRRQHEAESALRCSTVTLKIDSKMETCRNEIVACKIKLSACQTKDLNCERIKDEYNCKIQTERNNSAAVTKENQVLKQEISFCTTESRYKTRKMLEMQSDLDVCRNASEVLQENISDLSSQMNVSNIMNTQTINELTTDLQTTRNNKDSLNITLQSYKTYLTASKTEIVSLKNTVRTCNTDLNKLKTEQNNLNQTFESCNVELSTSKSEVTNLNANVEFCNVELSKSESEVRSLNINFESCNVDLTRTKTSLETVNATVQSLNSSLTACGKTSEDRKTKMEECASQKLSAQKSHESALKSLNDKLELASVEQERESRLKMEMMERFNPMRDQLVRESNGKVFKIGNEVKVIIMKYIEWQNASDVCTSIGMKLVSFQTQQKWLAIKNYLDNNGYKERHFWTSGRSVRGEWRWSTTNEVMTFAHWTLGKPGVGEDLCVLFYNDGRNWHSSSCSSDANHIICE